MAQAARLARQDRVDKVVLVVSAVLPVTAAKSQLLPPGQLQAILLRLMAAPMVVPAAQGVRAVQWARQGLAAMADLADWAALPVTGERSL